MGKGDWDRMATSWTNTGGPKFYEGNRHETVWNQNLHQKSVNEKESKFLLEIQAGTHNSQKIPTKKGPFAVDRNSARDTHRSSSSALSKVSSARMNGAIGDLHHFNASLKDELAELKHHLHATYDRLERAEKGMLSRRTGDSSARSQSSMGSSCCSSRQSTARSEVEKVLASARSAIERSSPKRPVP